MKSSDYQLSQEQLQHVQGSIGKFQTQNRIVPTMQANRLISKKVQSKANLRNLRNELKLNLRSICCDMP